MKFSRLIFTLLLASTGLADRSDRQALTYASLPEGIYAPSVNASITTLLDFIKSRSELSILANLITECGGKYAFPHFLWGIKA
jgi:hypothetical protein